MAPPTYGWWELEPTGLRHRVRSSKPCIQSLLNHPDESLSGSTPQASSATDAIYHLFSAPTPIYGLPRELLLEIFLLSVTDDYVQTSHAFTLSCISRYWRNIVLHAPELWSSIKIYCSEEAEDLRHIQPVELHLERSRNRPLIISVHVEQDTEDLQFVEKILDIVSDHSKRWKSLDLELPENLLRSKLACVKGKQPILEDLALTVHDSSPIPDNSTAHDMFMDCPSLTGIRISQSFPLHLPWEGLVRIEEITIPAFQTIPGTGPITLPNLVVLNISLTDCPEASLLSLLRRLELPALEQFFFNNITENVWKFLPTRALRPLISTTKYLRKLKFSYFMCPEEELLDILRDTKELEEITLWPSTPLDQRFGQRMLKSLAQLDEQTHQPIIAPKLAMFNYGSVGGPLDGGALYDFFWARFMGRADEGRQVNLTLYRTDYMELVPIISMLIEEGGTNLFLNVFGHRHVTLLDQIFFLPGNCVIKNAAFSVKIGRFVCLHGMASPGEKQCDICTHLGQSLNS